MQRLAMMSLLLASILAFSPRFAFAGELPGPAIPEGFGVNIHFTDPRSGEMEMLVRAGFRWVRMDFNWAATLAVSARKWVTG